MNHDDDDMKQINGRPNECHNVQMIVVDIVCIAMNCVILQRAFRCSTRLIPSKSVNNPSFDEVTWQIDEMPSCTVTVLCEPGHF